MLAGELMLLAHESEVDIRTRMARRCSEDGQGERYESHMLWIFCPPW